MKFKTKLFSFVVLVFVLVFTLFFPLVSATSVGTSDMIEGRVVYTPPIAINYSIIGTNRSDYWGDHFYTDYDLLVPYTSATSNIDLGIYNLTTEGSGIFEGSGTFGNDLTQFYTKLSAIVNSQYYGIYAVANAGVSGLFSDETGTNIVSLADGTYAVNATGNSLFIGNAVITGLGTLGSLDVDTLNLNGNVISDSTGVVSFSNDNVSTTGNVSAGFGSKFGDGTYYWEMGVENVAGFKIPTFKAKSILGTIGYMSNGLYLVPDASNPAPVLYFANSTNPTQNWLFRYYVSTTQNLELRKSSTAPKGDFVIGDVANPVNLNITGTIINSVAYAQLSNTTDQSFASVNVGQPVNVAVIDEINNLSVSVSNVSVSTSGVYSIFAQPQVTASAGQSGNFHMWLQKHDTSNWVNVSNSNVELSLGSQEEDVIPLIVAIKLNAGEKVRVMASVSNTGITLDAQTIATEPTIPSIIFTMYRIGS